MQDKFIHFTVKGLHCSEEISSLKNALGPIIGEDNLIFDLLNSKMSIRTESETSLNIKQVQEVVRRCGMQAELWQNSRLEKISFLNRYGMLISLILSGFFLLSGFVVHWIGEGSFLAAFAAGKEKLGRFPLAGEILYAFTVIFGGWFIFPKAVNALRRLKPDMNLLMVIAVLGAWAIGAWFEAATVTFLFSLSLFLESWSIGKAKKAVEALMDLTPPIVTVRNKDQTEEALNPQDVKVGMAFVVKPGERIPLDGIVLEGLSEVNQAPITGESLPIEKAPGAAVFAGSINGGGALVIESTKPYQDTILAHIIKQVESAQSKRSASERWVDHFASYYTPLVILFALGVLLIPTLILNQNWGEWIYRALVLLVIACPCALVISTPVCIVVSLAAAARHGVLVKGGLYLEIMDKVRAIAFDKTGTLTKGIPVVKEIIPLNNHTEIELLERVASLEARSNHPLARAIMKYTEQRGIKVTPAENYQIIPGKGATAIFDERVFWLGSHRYLEERGQETPAMHDQLEELSSKGFSVIVVGNEEHVCGLIAISDEVRQEASGMIKSLKEYGVQHLAMLTGDNQGTANSIAQLIGIDEVHAELLPADKLELVSQFTEKYGKTAMVGDGVNDAPAMARASVAIAMGAAGSDTAIETADIALMGDDLTRIPWLIQLSRHTLSLIRQNITFALSLKVLFMLLTLFGYAYLWAAIAADTGASLIVIFNSLRILKK